ncbi:hypothetical protein NC653_000726 [Populus alba x Populus x berolinensis]|uniref:Uncharacterized protein n=1 Tax=Populus alba x Populus x berolinensis TaxID=444605 RepID=A0AAD6RJR7_9ROSI|nr:hypothetical protein NC653_000726 [Populus alba x Populus x berolinensis]
MILTLSQWLGSFPTESKAEIFPQCRQDCPLPPPINRGGFHGLREGRIGSKVSQKTSFSSGFCTFIFLSISPPLPQLPSPARIPTHPAYIPPKI